MAPIIRRSSCWLLLLLLTAAVAEQHIRAAGCASPTGCTGLLQADQPTLLRQLLQSTTSNTGTLQSRCSTAGVVAVTTWLQTFFVDVGTVSGVGFPDGDCSQIGVATLANSSALGPDGSKALVFSSGRAEQLLLDPNGPAAGSPTFMSTDLDQSGSVEFSTSGDATTVQFDLTITGNAQADPMQWLTLDYIFGSREYASLANRPLEGAIISIAPAAAWPSNRQTMALAGGNPVSIQSFNSTDTRFKSNLPSAGAFNTPLYGFGTVRQEHRSPAAGGNAWARSAMSGQPAFLSLTASARPISARDGAYRICSAACWVPRVLGSAGTPLCCGNKIHAPLLDPCSSRWCHTRCSLAHAIGSR